MFYRRSDDKHNGATTKTYGPLQRAPWRCEAGKQNEINSHTRLVRSIVLLWHGRATVGKLIREGGKKWRKLNGITASCSTSPGENQPRWKGQGFSCSKLGCNFVTWCGQRWNDVTWEIRKKMYNCPTSSWGLWRLQWLRKQSFEKLAGVPLRMSLYVLKTWVRLCHLMMGKCDLINFQ